MPKEETGSNPSSDSAAGLELFTAIRKMNSDRAIAEVELGIKLSTKLIGAQSVPGRGGRIVCYNAKRARRCPQAAI